MPIFHEVKFDPDSGRHELFFVNQQYDYLMIIAYDPEKKIYRHHTQGETPQALFGADFNLDYWLKEAERLCKEADEKLITDAQEKQVTDQKQRDEWAKLVAQLEDTTNMKQATEAARKLWKKASAEHTPALYELLKSSNAFVRESVAVPLASLEKMNAFDALCEAITVGESQGHDNDGLYNTMIGVLESNEKESASRLLKMLKDDDPTHRCTALWGLGYVYTYADPALIFEAYLTDSDEEVRNTAGETLQIYASLKEPKGDNTPFQGKWMWKDTPDNLQYAFDISGYSGACTKNNAPTYAVGDAMLQIKMCHRNAFVGRQIFTNGAWYPVTARVDDKKLHMEGGGHRWTMERI